MPVADGLNPSSLRIRTGSYMPMRRPPNKHWRCRPASVFYAHVSAHCAIIWATAHARQPPSPSVRNQSMQACAARSRLAHIYRISPGSRPFQSALAPSSLATVAIVPNRPLRSYSRARAMVHVLCATTCQCLPHAVACMRAPVLVAALLKL
jgi:hypothetical protein